MKAFKLSGEEQTNDTGLQDKNYQTNNKKSSKNVI
jgi:hypothetical protein